MKMKSILIIYWEEIEVDPDNCRDEVEAEFENNNLYFLPSVLTDDLGK